MLCIRDLKMNFVILHAAAVLGFIPFRVCSSHGLMEAEKRIWKKIIYYFHQMLSVIHVVFTVTRLIQAAANFGDDGNDDIHHFGCAFICTTIPFFARVAVHTVYRKNQKIFCSICNQVLQHFARNPTQKLSLGRMLNMSLQELMAITIGLELSFAIVLHIILYFWNPLAFNFFHSIFPAQWLQEHPKYSLIFGLLLEIYAISVWLSTTYLMVFCCVIFFKMSNEKPEHEREILIKKRACGRKLTVLVVEHALKKCREFQLCIQIYNSLMSTVVWLMKQTTLVNTVFILFIAINGMRRGELIIAGVFAVLGFIVALVFPIAFNDTFMIPRNCAAFKKEILMTCRMIQGEKGQGELKFKEFTKTVHSIAEIGIKQGGFKVMERTSTPEFLDFVIGKLVDLIITF